jgi:hypothetical protein
VVHEAALQLFFLYLLGCPTLKVATSSRPNQQTPYTWLAAVLLVAIKLLYGMGAASGQLPLLPKAAGNAHPQVPEPGLCQTLPLPARVAIMGHHN